jgi:uncharacterized sodium:solute symporter family permease YidK
MRKTYRILATVIAIEVVLQAIFIVFAVAGLFHWIENEGGTLDKSVVDSWSDTPPTWTGSIGHFLHVMNGQFLIPILGLALLIVSFFAKVPMGSRIAAAVLVAIVIQVMLGLTSTDWPYAGALHGLNAFVVLGGAVAARKAAAEAPAAEPVAA